MKKRIKRLQKECKHFKVSAFYTRDVTNIQWLTGFDDVFDDEQAHALVVPAEGKGAALLTDSRYALAARAQQKGSGVRVDDARLPRAKWLTKQLRKLGRAKGRVAIEDTITLAEYRALEERIAKKRLCATHDVMLGLRSVKDEDELARIARAQSITDEAFSLIVPLIKCGMTEREVQHTLDDIMFRLGARGLSFPTIVAAGAHAASPHAQPTDIALEAGMCVVMDFGAAWGGYCSDMTRTVFLGQPFGDMLRAWEAIRSANEQVQAALAPGMTGAEAHATAEDILAEHGFGGCMGHGLGHGVGMQIHELPVLNSRNDKPLEPGNVVTVEPGIYLPDQFGMRLEDMGVITDNGFATITKTSHEMIVI